MRIPGILGGRRAVSLLPLFALIGLSAVLPPTAAEEPVTQAEWVAYLSRGLGLEEGLTPPLSTDRYVSLLRAKGFRRVEAEDYREASGSAAIQSDPRYGVPSREKWVEAKGEPAVLKYRFEIPVGREYTLRVRSRGDIQFWTVDDKGSVLVRPKHDFEWVRVGRYNLKAGEHSITASVSPPGGVDVFELITGSSPAVEPTGGYRPLAPLTYGVKAATIVKALGLEDALPIDEGFYLFVEAERFDSAVGKFKISESDRYGHPSEKKWLQPIEGVTDAHYTFEVPEDGMYSIRARVFGSTYEVWTVDQGRDRVEFRPRSTENFGWHPVTALYLEEGAHTIDTEIRRGSGSDLIILVRKRASEGAYLQLLTDLGFTEGALPGREPLAEENRRYEPCLDVEGERYGEAEGKCRVSSETKPYGTASDGKWLAPVSERVTVIYPIELKEEGTYAVYVRNAGYTPQVWTIDPKGEEEWRERMKIFPLSEKRFLWQELVTLDLARGKHTLQVDMAPGSGLDLFELRKRGPTSAELQEQADAPVGREAALKNLREVEELVAEEGIEEEYLDEGGPEDEEPDEYPAVSPFLPGV